MAEDKKFLAVFIVPIRHLAEQQGNVFEGLSTAKLLSFASTFRVSTITVVFKLEDVSPPPQKKKVKNN